MLLKSAKVLIGISFLVAPIISYAMVPTGVENRSATLPQQQLFAITENYQAICQSDDCQQQLSQLKKYARWGDAKSQLVLASAYFYGDGMEQNTDRAIIYYKRVAYNDSSKNAGKYSLFAFHTLAKIYQAGIGVNPDQELANKYFDKLTKLQYGPVLFDKAFIEFKQDNIAQGITLLEQASNSNYEPASYYLARMYQHGNQVDKDIEKAAIFYEKIVKSDYKDSRQRLVKIIAQLENDRSQHTSTALVMRQKLIDELNFTLDIEVVTVNPYAMTTQGAMSNLLVRLKKDKRRFGVSRIQCGKTSLTCWAMTEEDLEDARFERDFYESEYGGFYN